LVFLIDPSSWTISTALLVYIFLKFQNDTKIIIFTDFMFSV
jgi:hypothetical protein